MIKKITAAQIIGKIRQQCGPAWNDSPVDTINAGKPDTPVSGIATSFTPSIEVLRAAVAGRKNMIITQQPAWYLEKEEYFQHDLAYNYKKDLIDRNSLVLWRFYDNWNARPVDGQLLGLTKALRWDKYHLLTTPGEPFAKENKYFRLPETTLRHMVAEIKQRLNIKGIRVIGDPDTPIRKAALSHGMFRLSELQEFLKDPEVDLIVIAEAIEWESCEYFRDILTWKGKNKAMILLGREVAEDPGYAELASWLQTFIKEVPVEWIPAKEPFWIPA